MLLRLTAVALIFSATVAGAACAPDRVDLRGDWDAAAFRVEIADEPRERAQGLMFRETMARGDGMLFVYEAPGSPSFWMKNTLIPLDMLFIDPRGRITHIHHNAMPGDLTPISGGDNVFAVLEINGGLARRYGITVGSDIRHPVFAEGPAIWPC